jgi:hypothetical protein
VNDFFDPDISWALRKVYICTVVERNLAEFIADLPVIFPLLRSIHKKTVRVLTHGSRGASEPTTYGMTTKLTNGSTTRGNKSTNGDFDVYGKNGRFAAIQDDSDDKISGETHDEIPLRSLSSRRAQPARFDREITVQVNIDVESEARRHNESAWPLETLRPDL